MSRLHDALHAGTGIVCAVGAGGKKSTLYRLLADHPGRAAFTASVYTTFLPETLAARQLIAPEAALREAVLACGDQAKIVYLQPGDKPARLCAVSIDLLQSLHEQAGFDATYVKADGARMRWIKSPRHDEPMIPPRASTVLVLASARALGERLDPRIAQRVELIEQISGARSGQVLQPRHLASLLTSEQGLLKGTAGFDTVPVINMVDDAPRRRLAVRAAELALAQTDRFTQVVLTCMKREGDPLVEVIR